MQKLKRILALIGAILLAGMYLVTLVLGLIASPATKNMLMAAIACTVIIPCLIYGFMLVARVLDNRGNVTSKNEDEQAEKEPEKLL